MSQYKKQPEYNWIDLFEVCYDLKDLYNTPKYSQSNSKSEGLSRSIVNRAYYSCYSKATTNLKNKNNYSFRKGRNNSGHQDLLDRLEAMTEKGVDDDLYITEEIERKRYSRIKGSLELIIEYRSLVDYNINCINNHKNLASDSLIVGKYIFDLFYCLENNIKFNYANEDLPQVIKDRINKRKEKFR